MRDDDFIVERAGKAMVAIVSMEKYEIMRQNREEARMVSDIIKRKMKGADITTIDALITKAISDIRA